MFVSPCTLRSAHCAALIALAAAAGISRVERTEAADATKNDRNAVRAQTGITVTANPFFTLQSTLLARWSQPWLAFARWVLAVDADARAEMTGIVDNANAPLPAAALEETFTPGVTFSPPAEEILFTDAPRAALCTQNRLLPFAVGPPAGGAIKNPNAGDTFVSCNTTARGVSGGFERIASLARVAADARLAREICLSREWARPTFLLRRDERGRTKSRVSFGRRACHCSARSRERGRVVFWSARSRSQRPTPFLRVLRARASLTAISFLS